MSDRPAPPDASPSPARQRLNSWKEIAGHLGKSVRTVQRWERLYSVPVHRLGQQGSEIVWAMTQELDAWVVAQSKRGASSNPQTTPDTTAAAAIAVAAPVPVAGPVPVAAPARRWPLAVAAGFVAIAGIGAIQVWRSGTPVDAVDWAIEGRSLVGIARNGERIWTYEFPGQLDKNAYNNVVADKRGSALLRRDIDGDGRLETLVAFRTSERPSDTAFHVLGPDGKPRFPAVRPSHSVTFGSAAYHGPWTAHRLFVTTTVTGDVRMHVSFIHLNEFPTLLATLDKDGRVVSEYWSNGYIETVNTGTRNGRRVWLVGATHNDSKGASLAIFDEEPFGSAPASRDAYVCRDCPAGSPAAFVVFPRLCLAPAWTVSGQATLGETYTDAAGLLFAHVREGPTNAEGVPQSEVIYTFDAALQPVMAFVTSGLLVTHRDLERKGLLTHPWSPREESTLFPALRWDGSRFVELPASRVVY